MQQTNGTAIVLRCADYRENDRMLTLFSPSRGRLEVIARGCRRPKSPLLNAAEPFALGDFELYEKNGRMTVTAVTLTETFYALRSDFERLSCGVYLLNLCEAAVQPDEGNQELFMLLLHTLSRLTFTDQPWRPLLTGFLAHFSAIEGFRPRLRHCVRCGKRLEGEKLSFDPRGGGPVCADHEEPGLPPVTRAQLEWLRTALASGSASWVDPAGTDAPLRLMRRYVELRLDRPLRSAALLPD